MKKAISIMLMLVMVLSLFSIMVSADGEDVASADGSDVALDSAADPEDAEVQQFDAISSEEQASLVEEIVEETEATDEELVTELALTEGEKELVGVGGPTGADCKEYSQECESGNEVLCEKWKTNCQEKIGIKQLVLNRQLEHRIKVSLISTDAILKHLEKKGTDVTALKEIQEKIKAVTVTDELTKEDFAAKLDEVKGLVKQFKDKVHELVPAEEIAEVKEAVEKEKKEKAVEIDALKQKEQRIREFFNKKEQAKAFKKINAEVKGLLNENQKLIAVKERYTELKELQEQYLGQNATKENVAKFREEWKAKLQEYKQARFEDKLTNERVELIKEAQDIRKAIVDAKQAGEDTTELEKQLEDQRAQVKELVPGKVKRAEADAKVGVAKNKINNLKENPKIKNKVQLHREDRIKARIKAQEGDAQ